VMLTAVVEKLLSGSTTLTRFAGHLLLNLLVMGVVVILSGKPYHRADDKREQLAIHNREAAERIMGG